MTDIDNKILSPDHVQQAPSRSDTRPLSRLPTVLVIFVGMVLLFVIVYTIIDTSKKTKNTDSLKVISATSDNTSNWRQLFGESLPNGLIESDKPIAKSVIPETLVDANNEIPDVDNNKPIDDRPAPPPENPDVESQRVSELKEQFFKTKLKQFEQAMTANTVVNFSPKTVGATLGRTLTNSPAINADERYQQQLAKAQRVLGVSGGSVAGRSVLSGAGTRNQDAGFEQFSANAQEDRWALSNTQEAPRTAYEVRAGAVIPATMISGINSNLPGQIMAQVNQNVYDTATGRYLLIPQGSRLIGQYSNEVLYGQERVLVGWQRVVFPDGKALDIGSMPGADGAGYGGFNDQVNNHYVRIFGSAILMSFITAGFEYSQDNNDNDDDDDDSVNASDALSEALGQELGITISKMIQKNLDIAPTLEIRPGYRFNVMVTKDLTFVTPYKSFDY